MTTTMVSGAITERTPRRMLDRALLAGLAGVFLVNTLVAVIQPADFSSLVARSLLGRLWPAMSGDWMTWAIAINDGLLGLGLVAAIWSPRLRPAVLAWSGLWLLAVTVVKLTSLHALGG